MTIQDIPVIIERLRKCAHEHRKDMQYSGHERITPLCVEVANFLEKEYVNKNGENE